MTHFLIIPDKVWDGTNLNRDSIIIYGLIYRYCHSDRCFASNKHFAEKINCSVSHVEKCIRSLIKANLITSKVSRKGKKITKRILSIVTGDIVNIPEDEKCAEATVQMEGTLDEATVQMEGRGTVQMEGGINKRVMNTNSPPNNTPRGEEEKNSSTSQIDEVNAQGSEADCSHIQNQTTSPETHNQQRDLFEPLPETKPKKLSKEKRNQRIAQIWDEVAVELKAKVPGRRPSGVSKASANQIDNVIKLAKSSGASRDYQDPESWRKYFETLIRDTDGNQIVMPHRCFKWAVHEDRYENLINDVYERFKPKGDQS